jgi:histidine triad (HIT) family protein
MEAPCVFCRIVAKQLPSKIIDETNDLLVIQDIAPKTPVHWLIMPKKHIVDLQSMDDTDTHLASAILMISKKLSEKLPDPRAFRLVANNGFDAGQRVFHLHFHFLSGSHMEF